MSREMAKRLVMKKGRCGGVASGVLIQGDGPLCGKGIKRVNSPCLGELGGRDRVLPNLQD